MPCPELLFAQMAEVLSLAELVFLGFELCGTFSCAPAGLAYDAVEQVPRASSVEELRSYLGAVKGVRGRKRALLAFADGALPSN